MPLYEIETHGNLEPHLHQEWLLTNSLGGFASSTVVGCNERRYHGLLCAAMNPPVGRVMALSRIGEILHLDGDGSRLLELSINDFGGGNFHPRGDRYLRKFTLDDQATWEFNVDGVRVVKRLKLLPLQNVAEITYEIEPDRPRAVEMNLLVFVNMRDFHALRHAGGQHLSFTHDDTSVTVEEGKMRLRVQAEGARFVRKPDWWLRHHYQVETDRGQDDSEDLFNPGHFVLQTRGLAKVVLRASMDPAPPAETFPLQHPKVKATASPTIRRLVRASNDFVVRRRTAQGEPGTTIIAGYPWFADWGRDTMISLPGLLLCTERFEEARQVLSLFANYVSEGMIPNRFDDYTNQPHYNTVDASLWFIHSVFEYVKASGDTKTFDSLLRPACQKILDGYTKGTRFNIVMDPKDYLITQGDEHTQLTWMDAKRDGHAFTPRQGKAVEINALWHNALKLMGDDAKAAKVAESFRTMFWISPFRGLCDVVDGSRRDMAVRPNQIFAVSLPHSPLTKDQQISVVEVVRRELLTPMGLRTLSASDPNYKPRFEGSMWDRDAAYHNGTVWPWPIGAFIEAWLKTHNHSLDAVKQGKQWLQPLIDHLDSACIGQISEVFDAEEPRRAAGCFAQAWSVAEVLRAAMMLGM
jgi:predicted glycogen debranching enzyme